MNTVLTTLDFTTVPQLRSLENPADPLWQADSWAWAMGGAQTSAGVTITRDVALTYAAVWRAVDLISSSIAKVPLRIFRRLEGRNPEKAKEHPAYPLLRRRPNQYMLPYTLKQVATAHVLLHGNAYIYVDRLPNGSPYEMLPLLPDKTWPVREDGRQWYVTKVAMKGGHEEERKLDGSKVIHVKGLGYDGMVGYSVLTMARESLGLGIGAARYGARFFANNARPGGLIEVAGPMPEQAQKTFLKQWNEMHQGLDNAHKVAILTNGGKFAPMTISAHDSQLIETRQFEIREVANWFGVPPHKLGDSSRTAYNSLEQENQSFLDDCLERWFVAWEEECGDKLLTESEKTADTHYLAFDREAVVYVDAKTLTETLGNRVDKGLITLNEARSRLNLPPVADDNADRHRMPTNLTYIDMPTPATVPPTADSGDESAEQPDTPDAEATRGALVAMLRALVGDAARRAATRLDAHAAKAARKPAEFLAWLDAFGDEHREALDGILRPPIEALAIAAGAHASAAELIDAWLADARRVLLEASECQPAALPDSVKRSVAGLTARAGEFLCDLICEEHDNGN